MRRARGAVAALIVATILTACTPASNPPTEVETRIPAALTAADLGVVDATAGISPDGLTYDLDVTIGVERDKITADELRQILEIVVETAGEDTDPSDLSLIAEDTTQPANAGPDVLVDLHGPAQELGFDKSISRGNTGISIPWADLVDFIQG